MRPKPRVIVIGDGIPVADGWERIRCDAEAIRVASESPCVAILGDEAIGRLVPQALREATRAGLVLILVPRECDYDRHAAWSRTLRRLTVRPERLGVAVDEALRRGVGVVRQLDPDDWCRVPVTRGTAIWDALVLVPLLEKPHNVNGWADALSWSRQVLWDLCVAELGARPAEVLFWHIEAQVAEARSRGFTIREVALALHYSSETSLVHAFGHRGRRIPRRPQ